MSNFNCVSNFNLVCMDVYRASSLMSKLSQVKAMRHWCTKFQPSVPSDKNQEVILHQLTTVSPPAACYGHSGLNKSASLPRLLYLHV